MTAACRVCTARTDAFLCGTCADQLAVALGDLPADLADLQRVATLQASGPLGLGDPRRQWNPERVEPSRLPAWLRSLQGPIALPATPWPYSPGAADLLWTAVNTVTGWARHIAETRAVTIDTRPDQWLLTNLDAIRYDEAAAQIHDEITWLRAAIDAAILGRIGLEDYYGRCDAPGVRVEPLHLAGPPCTTLTCGHVSCQVIRGDRTILTTVVGTCGAEMMGPQGEAQVQCRACGQTYDAKIRKAQLRGMVPDEIATIREIADGLTKLDQPVTVDGLESAIRRKQIPVRGTRGVAQLVRVGDVQAYLERVAARRKTDRMSA